jgi:hypothetical protein
MYLQKVTSKNNLTSLRSLTKIAGPDPDQDPLVRGMDPRIRIRTKISWIRNAGLAWHLLEMDTDPDRQGLVV